MTAVLGLKLDIKSVILGLMFGIYDHLGLDMGYGNAILCLILVIGRPSWDLYQV